MFMSNGNRKGFKGALPFQNLYLLYDIYGSVYSSVLQLEKLAVTWFCVAVGFHWFYIYTTMVGVLVDFQMAFSKYAKVVNTVMALLLVFCAVLYCF